MKLFRKSLDRPGNFDSDKCPSVLIRAAILITNPTGYHSLPETKSCSTFACIGYMLYYRQVQIPI